MIFTKKINFYDTSSLLLIGDSLFENNKDEIALSIITLKELEKIKTAVNKDPDIKYSARQVVNLLENHFGEYQIVLLHPEYDLDIANSTNDTKILACANYLQEEKGYAVNFITNDLCLKHLARHLFDFYKVSSINEDEDIYDGYLDIQMNDEEMANFYNSFDQNVYNLLENEYIIIRNRNGEVVDTLCWTKDGYRSLRYSTFSSKWFGDVKPIKNDIYQALVADSFLNNKITMVKGPAGSGKTFLSLSFLLNQLEKERINKIVIFCNTVATKDSAKMGYYPGTRDEKLLDSQIGNLLISKFGDRCEVERLIADGKLVILPMSDIRGYDTTGMRAGVYISEAQNLSVSLMKLALQRIDENSICIIDGDSKAQVDDIAFSGNNNGMKRASKIFKGHDVYGEVGLKIIHRSRIGQIAEKM